MHGTPRFLGRVVPNFKYLRYTFLCMPPTELDEWYRTPADDRGRGILTKSDRKFLRGESDIEPQSHGERRARARIRERLRNAIYDLSLLFVHLEERDRKQVFNRAQLDDQDAIALVRGMQAGLGLTYLGCADMEYPFATLLAESVKDAELTKGTTMEDVEINIDRDFGVSVAEIEERRALYGDEMDVTDLSAAELQQLHRIGVLSSDTFEEVQVEIENRESTNDEE